MRGGGRDRGHRRRGADPHGEGVDTHIHFICPQQAYDALAGDVTTFVGGGTGRPPAPAPPPAPPARATSRSCSRRRTRSRSTSASPARATPQREDSQLDQFAASARRPQAARRTGAPRRRGSELRPRPRRAGRRAGHHPHRHAQRVVRGRAHHRRLQGPHHPHLPLRAPAANARHPPRLRQANVLQAPGPTRPHPSTPSTISSTCSWSATTPRPREAADVAASPRAASAGETIAAEDVLHDLGRHDGIISSDSQAMGRVGEVITRTWQTADKMRAQRGRLPEERGENDSFHRIRRYIAKYTVNPAVRPRDGARDRQRRARQARRPRAPGAPRCSGSSPRW